MHLDVKQAIDAINNQIGKASGLATLDSLVKVPTVQLGGTGADNTKFLRGDQTWQVPAGGGAGNFGQATIPFANWLTEDAISVIGQTGLLATAKILASIYADNDDVYAQDWRSPIVRNVVAGVGFDVALRPEIGMFKGGAKINWTWSN